MTRGIALDTHRIALDLHALLRDTEPRQWCAEVDAGARARLEALRERVGEVLEARSSSEPTSVWSRVAELSLVLEHHTASLHAIEDRRQAWSALHAHLRPVYEQLAAALREYALHVPLPMTPSGAEPRAHDPNASLQAGGAGPDAEGIPPGGPQPPEEAPAEPMSQAPNRPTNYSRNLVHAACGVGVILLVEYLLVTPALRIGVALAGFVWAWSMEIGRRLDPRVNRLLMRFFGPIAHPHEYHAINSATWYTTAILVLAVAFGPVAGVVALAVLAFGDPVAAVIGRQFGRVRLVHGRSLEGTAAFVVAGSLAGLAVLTLWHDELSPSVALAVAASAALLGALAELFTRRIDDNLSIPVAAAIGASLSLGWLT